MFDCKPAWALATLTAVLGLQGCGGGSSQSVNTVPTVPAPVAAFAFSPAAPVTSQSVSFTDQSTGSPTSWSWSFGDGATSSSQNPSHAYAAAGNYTVTLTAANAGGASNITHSVTVSVPATSPSASFSYTPVVPVAGEAVDFTDSSTGNLLTWNWNFGDQGTSTMESPIHAYASAGPYTIALTAANSLGSSTMTQLIAVYSAPTSGVFDGNIMLGSPEFTSIKANVMSPDENGMLSLEYGTASGNYTQQTVPVPLSAGVPVVVTMSNLTANTQYFYRAYFQPSNGSSAITTPEYSFHTARPTGSTFTFTIQADSHLDDNTDPNIYRATLTNIQADTQDFHVDLGDTFMCEKFSAPFTGTAETCPNEATVDARYAFERNNYDLIAPSVPLFLANGNHEGEAGWLNDGTGNNIAIWTARARIKNFPNPVPDTFYTGDTSVDPFVGQRASWYAWQWGDALFIVLDPFWYTTTQPQQGGTGWNLTLGQAQYNWLEQTLASSTATFKFVFLHDLVGGLQGQMRGGVEAAPYYEWGGEELDGTNDFSTMRPGWAMPIHQLLVKYKVSAVFHGHDHLYARQQLDGIIYQEVPQPSAINSNSGPNLAASYGYASGVILSSSGYMRVTVSPKSVLVQYVRTWLPADETPTQQNGEIDDSYTISAP